ncbi:MAG: type II toxin-antitoxin system Phd/YefM family antitoxin [Dehalococcoidia bacterium]
MTTRQEQFVVDEKGKKTGVIVPVKQYQKLIEDLHDLAVVAERREEDTISFDELKSRLSKDGIL